MMVYREYFKISILQSYATAIPISRDDEQNYVPGRIRASGFTDRVHPTPQRDDLTTNRQGPCEGLLIGNDI